MANTLYKMAVRELEAVLPPRVVSQSLQEGLTAVGKNADTLSYGDAESILQNRVLPRLTLSLGEARAQTARREILARLSGLPDESELPAFDHGAQARALREVQDALKPFNILFDWPETQELRAQLALIATEHAAERNAGALIGAAQAQLGALEQKLGEALSVQARELADLEVALQESAALKSPKVRRLRLLLELIRSTQAARKLAPAEVERAHKLAGDLRAERSRLLGEEASTLRALEERFSALLTLEPTLAERLSTYRQETDTLLGESLTAFRGELETAQEALRSELQREFQWGAQPPHGPELTQLLTHSLETLETTLPPTADVQRVRELLRSGATPTANLEDDRDNPNSSQDLGDSFRAAQQTFEHDHNLLDLTSSWEVRETEVETPVNAQRADLVDRVAAAENAAAPFRGLNSEAAADLRGRVQRLRTRSESIEHASPEGRAELETTLQETEALTAALQREADVIRGVAAQLIQMDAFNDLFGGFSEPATPTAAPEAGAEATPQSWLERQVAHDEIDGLALFIGADTFIAGTLPTDADDLRRTVNDAVHADVPIDTPRTDHERGGTTRSVEMQGRTFVTFRLDHGNSLMLVTHAQGDAARQRLEAALPELVTLLG